MVPARDPDSSGMRCLSRPVKSASSAVRECVQLLSGGSGVVGGGRLAVAAGVVRWTWRKRRVFDPGSSCLFSPMRDRTAALRLDVGRYSTATAGGGRGRRGRQHVSAIQEHDDVQKHSKDLRGSMALAVRGSAARDEQGASAHAALCTPPLPSRSDRRLFAHSVDAETFSRRGSTCCCHRSGAWHSYKHAATARGGR